MSFVVRPTNLGHRHLSKHSTGCHLPGAGSTPGQAWASSVPGAEGTSHSAPKKATTLPSWRSIFVSSPSAVALHSLKSKNPYHKPKAYCWPYMVNSGPRLCDVARSPHLLAGCPAKCWTWKFCISAQIRARKYWFLPSFISHLDTQKEKYECWPSGLHGRHS